MAIYRIYPEQDTFISSERTGSNAGRDEIVEVGGFPVLEEGKASRILTQYKLSEIQDTINNKVSGLFSASINYYIAEATELKENISLEAWPASVSWDNGLGKYHDTPSNNSGTTWKHRSDGATNAWSVSSYAAYTTGSYSGSSSGEAAGGGTWYTGSGGVNYETTQSISLYQDTDINIDVTKGITAIYSESISNNGFIIKLSDSYEFLPTASMTLQYYSRDTNTIYAPYLEFRWDESSYSTGSLSVLSTDVATIGVKNNKGTYRNANKQRFRITAKQKYPTRTFTTGSIYNTNLALPSGSYWGIQDDFTDEMVVDFDTDYTKVSCDTNGSYFDVYMDTLQPQRYYKILISSSLDGSEVILDNDNIFKVVENG